MGKWTGQTLALLLAWRKGLEPRKHEKGPYVESGLSQKRAVLSFEPA